MRTTWIAIALGLLIAAGLGWRLLRQEPIWTTDSAAARAEFEEGVHAFMKYYMDEAEVHYERALELDPGFVAAKIRLVDCCVRDERREQLVDDIRHADPRDLSTRERFLRDHVLATFDREHERRLRIVADYLEAHPDDPFAVWESCDQAWREQDLEQAERCYRRLLEIDPNWVLAQNHLGYIAMARGRFGEAEQLFEAYKYIAPDQANPHDSLGELLTLIGRYDEAREELERALAIKPDFCPSYGHLLTVIILEGSFGEGDQIVERAGAHCEPEQVERLACRLGLWQDFVDGRYEAPWQEERGECLEVVGDFSFILHRMELLTGRRDEALAREERVRSEIAKLEEELGLPLIYARGFLHHLEGTRLALDGQFEAAADRFEEADLNLLFWYEGQGIVKLFNRLFLADVLERAGHAAAARRILAKIEAVNFRFAEAYPEIRQLFSAG